MLKIPHAALTGAGCSTANIQRNEMKDGKGGREKGSERNRRKETALNVFFSPTAFDHHLLKLLTKGCVRMKPVNHSNDIFSG